MSIPTAAFPDITKKKLEELSNMKCPCCGEPFNEDMRPDLAAKCHLGPLFVSYWDGYLYLTCGRIDHRQPVGRIAVTPDLEAP